MSKEVTKPIIEVADVVPMDPMALMARAVDKGADVDALGKLMDLQAVWEERKAKVAYHHALAQFQALCPSMKRTKKIEHNGVLISKYAPLDEIKSTIQPFLEQCGLAFTFVIQESEDGGLGVGCKVSHVDGHSETTWMTSAADTSGAKNAVQSRGSALTYLMRYTLCGALAITSADDDDDGGGSGAPLFERAIQHQKCVRDNFYSVYQIKEALATEDYQVAYEAWHELGKDVQMLLYLAPSKGGIFSTKERDQMKNDEWSAARTVFHGESGPADPE